MPDYAQPVIFWIAGLLAGLGIATNKEKTAQNVCVAVLASLACAFLLVFLLGVMSGILRDAPVDTMIETAVEAVVPAPHVTTTPSPVPTHTPEPTCTPVPTSTPRPPRIEADDDCPQETELPPWLRWLLYTSDKEG